MRILCSSRDPGAARQVVAVVKKALKRGWEIKILSQGEASNIFRSEGLSQKVITRFNLLDLDSEINSFSPDFVLVGLAFPDEGVDEYLCRSATLKGINTGTIQDYWGYLGGFNSTNTPNIYFVIDDLAAELTCKRLDLSVSTYVTGSPKHEMYQKIIFDFEKKTQNKNQIFVCGQPLFVPGYLENILCLAESISKISKKIEVLFKPHPSSKDLKDYKYFSNHSNREIQLIQPSESIEPFLLTADLTITFFSTAGLDHSYLMLYNGKAPKNLLYVTIGSKINEFIFQQCGINNLPPTLLGLGKRVTSKKDLDVQIPKLLFETQFRNKYLSSIKKILGKFPSPTDTVLDCISNSKRD